MDLLHILLLLLAGAASGFLAGYFGVGGGILLVPILLYYFKSIGVSSLVVTHVTFGTSLLVVVFAAIASAYRYSKNQHVIWKAVLFIGLASVVGAFIGTSIAAGLQGRTLQRIFGVVVLVAAVRLLMEFRRAKKDTPPNLKPAGLGLTGVVAGLVSSLAGVGGGVFSIPIMYNILHFPLKRALGTSSATIVITASAAAIGYMIKGWSVVDTYAPELQGYTLGFVAYLYAIPIIIGTIPLATLGAATAHKTHADVLQKIFAVFLLAVAVKMFFF